MQIAQKLYEGVNIGSETTGLITYMRTDGVQLGSEASLGTRRDRPAFRQQIPAEQPADLSHSGRQRAGSPRGYSPDRYQPRATGNQQLLDYDQQRL